MKRYRDYREARKAAGAMAAKYRLDVALRKTVEYGRIGFNISFAATNDSDYACAEIISAEAARAAGTVTP